MKLLLPVFLAALIILSGCSKADVMSPKQFTQEFAKELEQASPGLKVEILRDLELKLSPASGHVQHTAFLNNAYNNYVQNPKSKEEEIQRVVAANLETVSGVQDNVERSLIVPIIKDRRWMEESTQALLKRGAKKAPQLIVEDFTPDLVVAYAMDSTHNIRYLTPEDLQRAKVERRELRTLACENLKRLLPKIVQRGSKGVYMLSVGGTYESSLLLLDLVWKGGQMQVQGDFVVAIPTRNLLLVTGSQNAPGIEVLRQMIKEASKTGSYRLTQKLFVYRNGGFEEFTTDSK